MGGIDAFGFQLFDCLSHFRCDRPCGDENNIGTFAQFFATSDFKYAGSTVSRDSLPFSTRITDGKRTVVGRGGMHEIPQLGFVARTCYYHAWNRAHICQIEQAVVRHSILTNQPRAVDTEGYGESLNGYIVDYLIITSLQERGIYGDKRFQTLLCEPSGKCHGMPFRDTHIEHSMWHLFLQHRNRCTRRHGGCDAHNSAVGTSYLQQRVAKYILEFRRSFGLILGSPPACDRVETARSVPYSRIFLGRSIAFALYGLHMQQFGAFHVLDVVEHPDKGIYIMAVNRSEIAYIKTFEYILLIQQQRFQRIVETEHGTLAAVSHQTEFPQQLVEHISQPVVARAGVDLRQIAVEGTHIGVNRHVVVVEDYQQIVGGVCSVVDTFERKTTRHGSVADNGHHVSLGGVVVHRCSHGHSQCSRDGVGCVSCHEGVVFAFVGIGKPAETVEPTVSGKRIAAPGQ